MPAVLDDALCVRHWDWSETSQTVSLFTRAHGLVRALAKGARRPKAPYSGGIELLTRAEASLIIKPSSDLVLLTAWDLAETFAAVRRSLAAYYAGMYIAEVVQVSVTDRDPHPAMFDSAVDCLRSLDEPSGARAALAMFQWNVLVETGYRPVLGNDDQGPGGTRRFSPAHGGVVRDPPTTGSPVWSVRAETVTLLERLDAEGRLPTDAHPQTVDRAGRLLAAYLRYVLGRDLATAALVFGPDLPR
ncbi:MAG: DNA repair protein RecO [Phycisphaeraceae bacterium]|nr:DNA repair protein RecO [Phycisphaeraceae bacterium]